MTSNVLGVGYNIYWSRRVAGWKFPGVGLRKKVGSESGVWSIKGSELAEESFCAQDRLPIAVDLRRKRMVGSPHLQTILEFI